ncbi:MAG: hypothetical protein R3Y59_04695 [bacterium]
MIILLIISAFLCLGYAALVKIKFNVGSISQSYYKWKESIHAGNLFLAWTVVTAFTILPVWLQVTPDNYQFIAFLSAAALMFVGSVPLYLSTETLPHYLLAAVCIILSVVWSVIVGVWYVPLCLIPLSLIAIKRFDFIYWVEIFAILSIYGGLGIKMFLN